MTRSPASCSKIDCLGSADCNQALGPTALQNAVRSVVRRRLERALLRTGNQNAFSRPSPITDRRFASGRGAIGAQRRRTVGDVKDLDLMTGKLGAASEALANVVDCDPGTRAIESAQGGKLGRGAQGQMDRRSELHHHIDGKSNRSAVYEAAPA